MEIIKIQSSHYFFCGQEECMLKLLTNGVAVDFLG
jgi:hypothetical protein